MTNIYIDIETCPSQSPSVREEIAATIEPPGNISKAETIAAWHAEKKPAVVEEAWRKTSFDGAYGHVCVIGVAINDEEPVTFFDTDWHANEAGVLKGFFEYLTDRIAAQPNVRPVFVGHNILDFDLRFLFQRATVLGVKPSPHIPFFATARDGGVFDTMIRWAGTRDRVKLDKLSRCLGFDGKGDIDGSKVWDYVRDGRIEDVATYCAHDVELTRNVHKRMIFADDTSSSRAA